MNRIQDGQTDGRSSRAVVQACVPCVLLVRWCARADVHKSACALARRWPMCQRWPWAVAPIGSVLRIHSSIHSLVCVACPGRLCWFARPWPSVCPPPLPLPCLSHSVFVFVLLLFVHFLLLAPLPSSSFPSSSSSSLFPSSCSYLPSSAHLFPLPSSSLTPFSPPLFSLFWSLPSLPLLSSPRRKKSNPTARAIPSPSPSALSHSSYT